MPTLNDLPNISIQGVLVGAYDEQYLIQGLGQPVSQTELLQYIVNNLGGGTGGENEVTEAVGNPSAAPTAGVPLIYQNTANGSIWLWDQTQTQWYELCRKQALPVYDSLADALADGLSSGDQFKLSQSNTEGGVVGTVIEII